MTILTCFTTTVGLIVVTSQFFADTFKRFDYRAYVNIFTLTGFVMSNFGLNTIIKISIPVLSILYPVTIVIVLIVILNKFISMSNIGMRFTIILTSVTAFIEVIGNVFNIKIINAFMSLFIGGSLGFVWVNIAVLGIIISLILRDKIKGESFEI